MTERERIGGPTALIEERAIVLRDTAESLRVETADEYVAAAHLLREVKEYRRLVDAAFDTLISSAHRTWKDALAQKAKYEEPANLAERTIKAGISAYDAIQEKIRREEEARLRAEARREAEEKTLRLAEKAETGGNRTLADAILSNPIAAETVAKIEKPSPKVSGVSTRGVWRFRIVDEAALPREYLKPDDAKIGAMVRVSKDRTKIAGVEVYEERVVSAR